MNETAKIEADKIMLTDAPLLFPPGQVFIDQISFCNIITCLLQAPDQNIPFVK